MKIKTLEDAFIHSLSDIYSAEKQLTKALPKLARAAHNQRLADGFEGHLEETEDQVARIEKIVEECGIRLQRVKCTPMEAMIEESANIIENVEEGPVRDVLLIAGAQKVEHFEISAYGTLIELARQLDYEDAVNLLEDTLVEEKACDKKLNKLALNDVNEEALREAA